MRVIDTKNISTDSVLVTLMPANATQPSADSGGFQVCVSTDASTNTMVEGTSEYQVFSRESVFRRLARVISSDTTRRTAADKRADDAEQRHIAEPRSEHHRKTDERGELRPAIRASRRDRCRWRRRPGR